MVYFIRRESDIKWAEDLDDGSNFLSLCYHTSLQSDKTRIIVKIYRLLLYIDRDNINLNFQLILISNGRPHHGMPSLILLKLWLWSESFGPLNFSHEFQISLIFGLIFQCFFAVLYLHLQNLNLTLKLLDYLFIYVIFNQFLLSFLCQKLWEIGQREREGKKKDLNSL